MGAGRSTRLGRRGLRIVVGIVLAAATLAPGWAPPARRRAGDQLLEWAGDRHDDHLGWRVGRLPDLDGDGLVDVLMTTPGSDAAGADAGRLGAHSSGTGDPIWSFYGQPGEAVGTRLAEAGDIDGDGVADVLVGGLDVAYAVSGADGTRIRRIGATGAGDRAPSAVADLGDVDGDGRTDYAVGEPHADGSGRVTAFSGRRGKVLWSRDGKPGSDTGTGIATAPDVDGDGIAELVVSAPRAGAGGQVTLLSGTDGSELLGPLEPDEVAGNFGLGALGALTRDDDVVVWVADAAAAGGAGGIYVFDAATGDRLPDVSSDVDGVRFGTGVATADVDSDGVDDFLVGAIGSEDDLGFLALYSVRRSDALVRFASLVPGEQYGFSVRDLGDVTGDGATDFIVSAPWNDDPAERAGHAYLVAGDPRRAFGCRRVRKIVARCRPRHLLIKARTNLRGGILELLVDGDAVTMQLNGRGRGKLKLPPVSGVHEVILDRCPDVRRTADCR